MRFPAVLLPSLLVLAPAPAGQAQNFGNIKPNTVIGNPDPFNSMPAVPRAVDFFSPMDFGAKGDGVANDTAAVQAAMNAAANGILRLGPHLYAVDPLTCTKTVNIVGTQSGEVMWRQNNTPNIGYSGFVARAINETLLTLPPACIGSKLQDFFIGMGNAGHPNTSGWAISASPTSTGANPVVSNMTFEGLQIDYGCGGIDVGGWYWMIDRVTMTNMAGGTGCYGIRAGHNDINGSTIDPIISNTKIISSFTDARLDNGIRIEDAGGLTITYTDINYTNIGTVIKPGPGQQVTGTFFHDTVLGDTSINSGLTIDAGGPTAVVQEFQCNGCWASSTQSGNGINIVNTGGAAAFAGFHFLGTRVYNNNQIGVLLNAGTDIDFEGAHICGNNGAAGSHAGINVAGGVNHVRIRGGAIGGTCDSLSTTQGSGIIFPGGTNTNVLIQGVDLTQGNTAAINFTAGLSGRVEGNPGYNPAASGLVTVLASPFSYKAGVTSEYVCVQGGTVSSVTVGGTTMAAATNSCVQLAPGQTEIVTYSAMPTMSTSRQ